MGDGAEDAMAFEMAFDAHRSARAAVYDEDLELLAKVFVRLELGFHTQADGTSIKIESMTDKHLFNSIARGKLKGGDFWKMELPYLEAEQQVRMPKGGK